MFVGVDLAWSRNNETGVAVLSDDDTPAVVRTASVVDDDDIVGCVPDKTELFAVDAPLVVPNEEGQRPAEDELRPVYSEFNAGPYPANRNWLERVCGEVRGETLVDELAQLGFEHNPSVDTSVNRGIIEVYPHPAMVALFELDTVIPYKKRKNRSKEDIVGALRTYYDYLCEDTAIQRETLPDFELSTEDTWRAIKGFEDVLDGVFSAYVAWYLWRNPEEARVFGNRDEGYITSPRL